jgi:hypothetical protein
MLKVKQTFYEAMKEVDLEIPILYILLFLHILLCTKDLAAESLGWRPALCHLGGTALR